MSWSFCVWDWELVLELGILDKFFSSFVSQDPPLSSSLTHRIPIGWKWKRFHLFGGRLEESKCKHSEWHSSYICHQCRQHRRQRNPQMKLSLEIRAQRVPATQIELIIVCATQTLLDSFFEKLPSSLYDTVSDHLESLSTSVPEILTACRLNGQCSGLYG